MACCNGPKLTIQTFSKPSESINHLPSNSVQPSDYNLSVVNWIRDLIIISFSLVVRPHKLGLNHFGDLLRSISDTNRRLSMNYCVHVCAWTIFFLFLFNIWQIFLMFSEYFSLLRPHGLTFRWWGCCGLYLWHKPTELDQGGAFSL